MLQTLNSLGYFKKAIFKIPVDNTSITYALQRLFYDLHTLKNPISTSKLIKSFGWGRDQILIQHDIQEFNIILNDCLEKKMKGTEAEGTFKYLFEGKLENYIQCINVDFKSKKEETFSDIQLTVKGCSDIYNSLDKYVEEERLDNENKYDAEGHGKQDALKGVKFLKIPPVMIFQLKRFEYNIRKDYFEKINDRFEFYETLNMRKYLNCSGAENSSSEDHEYELHSIVVHSGSINNGHYYCYIKSNHSKNQWIKFNDEHVRKCEQYEAVEKNFGGLSKIYRVLDNGYIQDINIKNDTSAYILVYVQKSKIVEILSDFNLETDIPKEISDYIDFEKQEEEKQRILHLRSINNIDVNFLTKETIGSHTSIGITNGHIDLNKDYPLSINSNYKLLLSVPKKLLIGDLKAFIQDQTGIRSQDIKFFKYDIILSSADVRRRNFFRMAEVNDDSKRLTDVLEYKKKKLYMFMASTNPECSFLENRNESSSEEDENLEFPIDIIEDSPKAEDLNNPGMIVDPRYQEADDGYNSSNYQHKIVLNKRNKWKFHMNKNYESCSSIASDSYRLILLKYPVLDQKIIQSYNSSFHEDRSSSLSQTTLMQVQDAILVDSELSSFQDLLNLLKPHILKRYNQILNAANLLKNLNIQNSSVDIFLENSSTGRNTPLADIIQKTSDLEIEINPFACYVLIPVLKSNYDTITSLKLELMIREFYRVKFDEVYVKLKTHLKRRHFFLDSHDQIKKYRFMNSDPKEAIQKRILEILKQEKKLLDVMTAYDEILRFVYTKDREVVSIEEFLYNFVDYTYVDISLDNNLNQRSLSMMDEFTLDDALIEKSFIEFKIKFYPYVYKYDKGIDRLLKLNSEQEEISRSANPSRPVPELSYYKEDIFFYDEFNNPIVMFTIVFPSYIKSCQQVICYIESLLRRYYDIEEEEVIDLISEETPKTPVEETDEDLQIDIDEKPRKFNLSNFFVILQNPNACYSYDIFIDRKKELRMYKNSHLMVYRLQPLRDEDIRRSSDGANFKRVFVSFVTRDQKSACDPMILYLENDCKVHKFKSCLIEKLSKVKKVRKYDLSVKTLKFYAFNINNNSIEKTFLLNEGRDEELVFKWFNRTPYNLLVEFPATDSNFNEGNINIRS